MEGVYLNTQCLGKVRQPFCLLLLFLLLFYGGNTIASAQGSSFEQGLEGYHKRAVDADSFRAEPQYINQAIEAFERAWEKEEYPAEAAFYLLKSYYFKGMYTGLSKSQQKEVFSKGRELGENAHRQFPDSVGIAFWYGANLGRWANVHGFLASATSGVAKTLRSLSQEIIDLNPEYEGGGGYRMLSQVYFHTPRIPIIMGWPSDERALELSQKALKIAPDHFSNLLLQSRILLSFDRKAEARTHLNRILEMEPRTDYLVPDRYVKHLADKMLQEHFKGESRSE